LARVRREPPLPLLLSELSCLVVSRFGMSSCFRSLSRAAPGTSHSRSARKAGPDLPNRQQPIHKTIWPCGPASTSSVDHGIKQAIKFFFQVIKQCFTVRALLPAPRSTLLAEFQVQRISSESGIIIPLKFRCKLYTLSTRCKISRAVPSCILGIQSTRNGRLPGCLPCFSRLESHEQQNRQSPDDSGVGAYRGPARPGLRVSVQ